MKIKLFKKTAAPKEVPRLARGAVLPANKPFLAVVGDQRRGTNVEAPLDTIRQALALELQSQNAALSASLEESVEVQRQLLRAVRDIRLEDGQLSAAADRYNTGMAVMKGV